MTVTADVVNDHGGTATPADATLYLNGVLTPSGTVYGAVDGQMISIFGGGPFGYSVADMSCVDDGGASVGMLFVAAAGETYECSVLIDDMPVNLSLLAEVDVRVGGEDCPDVL